ncbi:MAG: hypothetical protein QXT27_07720, partial [Pyrobaculum sp.]
LMQYVAEIKIECDIVLVYVYVVDILFNDIQYTHTASVYKLSLAVYIVVAYLAVSIITAANTCVKYALLNCCGHDYFTYIFAQICVSLKLFYRFVKRVATLVAKHKRTGNRAR